MENYKELTTSEMKDINGGSVLAVIAALIGAAIGFLIARSQND